MLVRWASRGATFDSNFWAEGCLGGCLGGTLGGTMGGTLGGGFGINLENQPRGGVLEGIDE